MNQYFIIINSRTLLTFIISLIVPFFAYKLNISYNIDLTLISIAIIFPVVFTVRGAFRRREKALEHISRFRGSMLTLENLFDENTKMEDDKKKNELTQLVDDIRGMDTFLSPEEIIANVKKEFKLGKTDKLFSLPVTEFKKVKELINKYAGEGKEVKS